MPKIIIEKSFFPYENSEWILKRCEKLTEVIFDRDAMLRCFTRNERVVGVVAIDPGWRKKIIFLICPTSYNLRELLMHKSVPHCSHTHPRLLSIIGLVQGGPHPRKAKSELREIIFKFFQNCPKYIIHIVKHWPLLCFVNSCLHMCSGFSHVSISPCSLKHCKPTNREIENE